MPPAPSPVQKQSLVSTYASIVGCVVALLALNKVLSQIFASLSIQFPAPIAGMLLIISGLTAANKSQDGLGDKIYQFFLPTLTWVARYMPIFFVPPLVVLPLAMDGVAGSSIIKLGSVLGVGWLASISLAAASVKYIRGYTKTEITAEEEPATTAHPLPPFSERLLSAWQSIALITFLLVPVFPQHTAKLGVAFTLAITHAGYLIGCDLPKAVRSIMHPIVVCAVFGTLGCAVWGYMTDIGYEGAMRSFLQPGTGVGAGNLLVNMLPVVVLCDAFRVFAQRNIVRRHFIEIAGTVAVCALFSLFATAAVASAVGLDPSLARSIISRSITMPFAMPMATSMGASTSLTAAFVCITGLIGAAAGQVILNILNMRDEITRGVAQAASSHGLGASVLAADEPEALPFSAVTIAGMGVLSNLLVSVPFVRSALLSIVG